jgi:hypothetical protein
MPVVTEGRVAARGGSTITWSRGVGTPVEVARSPGGETILKSGFVNGDVVVADGHLLFDNCSRVRERKAGA